jgi:hypothetical protein
MRSTDWKDIAELIGIAAIVASLIFVGLELQQSRKIAIADIYQQRAALAIDVQTSLIVPEQRLEIFRKYTAGESLSDFEKGLLNFSNNPWLSYYENNHFQYQLGLLSAEQWIASRKAMRTMVRRPIFRDWWEEERSSWRESFALEVDSVMEEEIAKK